MTKPFDYGHKLNVSNIAQRVQARSDSQVIAQIHEYEAITPAISRVVVSFTNDNAQANAKAQAISNALDNLATVVHSSFVSVDSKYSVGYVLSANAVQEYSELNMKKVTANLFMDSNDKMWDVRTSKSGSKYLVRSSEDDMSELLQLARVRAKDSPQLASIQVQANRSDFALFVSESGVIDYGHVLVSNPNKLIIVSGTEYNSVEVDPRMVVRLVPQDYINTQVAAYDKVSKLLENKKALSVTAASDNSGYTRDVKSLTDYYTELYSYDKDYLQQFVKMIKAKSVL